MATSVSDTYRDCLENLSTDYDQKLLSYMYMNMNRRRSMNYLNESTTAIKSIMSDDVLTSDRVRGYGHLEFLKNRFLFSHFLKYTISKMFPQNSIEMGAYLTILTESNFKKLIKQIKQIAAHEVSIAEEGSLYGPGIDHSM